MPCLRAKASRLSARAEVTEASGPEEREKRIGVYKILIEVLDELLLEIKKYTHDEAVMGFKLFH